MEIEETANNASKSIDINAAVKDALHTMSVAEFRNKINPMTKYYDNYDCDSFLMDDTIDLKTKIEVLFGKMIANIIDYSKVGDIYDAMMKGNTENGSKN